MRKSGVEKQLKELEYPNLVNADIIYKLSERTHALAKMPYYNRSLEPDIWREEDIATKRYVELIDSYSDTFKIDKKDIKKIDIMMRAATANFAAISKENGHREELCSLAEKIIREEWNIDNDEVIFDLELMNPGTITLPEETNMESPLTDEEKDELEKEMGDEIVKRRTINALAQGASLKGHYIFHLYCDEIHDIVPDVTQFYQKALIANDLIYYMVSDDEFKDTIQLNDSNNAGYVDLDFSGDIPKIIVKAINFPILIHEMIKGIISLLSVAGMPKDKAKEVINYTDTVSSEIWDIRLFPIVWTRLNEQIDENDYDIKKLILLELFKKSANEFIDFMKLLENKPDSAKDEISRIVRKKRSEMMEYHFESNIDDIDLSDLGL